jgi:hypothetical protein
MTEAAIQLYNSLTYSYIDHLISNGETEGIYLECKAPGSPQLTRDIKANLAKAISGFSNTAGGVILWGVSTTKHLQSKLDVLTQIEPIGNCKQFARQIENAIPTLSTPSIIGSETKIILKAKKDTRGILATLISQKLGDPVQSNIDNSFYFRSGDEFVVAPYEMIKRMFASTEIPDLHVYFENDLVNLKEDGSWEIPIIIRNDSSAIAEYVQISITIDNPLSCDQIILPGFIDSSDVNPGEKIFMRRIDEIVHRELSIVVSKIIIRMKVDKRPKRLLKFSISIYANKMRARKVNVSIHLAKKGFSVLTQKETYLY